MFIPISDLHKPEVLAHYKPHAERALMETPNNPDIYIVLACIYLHEQEYEKALGFAKQAIGFRPDYAGHYVTLAGILGNMGRFEEAGEALEKGFLLGKNVPSLNWNYSLWLLQHGHFQLGWDLYRWRKVQLTGFRRTLDPEWKKGDPIKGFGRLLLWCEQGYGDIIMMLRFVKYIKQYLGFKEVHFEVPAELYTLACRHTEGIDSVYIVRADLHTPIEFDHHMSIMDLPYNLGIISEEEFNGNSPYIIPRQDVIDEWKNCFEKDPEVNGKKRIGLCWRGSPGHVNDKNRSAKLQDFHPLVKDQNNVLFALVKEGQDDVPKEMESRLKNISGGLINADYTTGAIGAMDCIVTVDTFVAHLAGAMGKKVYLLLPFAQEWRWKDGIGTSYLYNTVEMFKQVDPGDWSTPIRKVCEAIAKNV